MFNIRFSFENKRKDHRRVLTILKFELTEINTDFNHPILIPRSKQRFTRTRSRINGSPEKTARPVAPRSDNRTDDRVSARRTTKNTRTHARSMQQRKPLRVCVLDHQRLTIVQYAHQLFLRFNRDFLQTLVLPPSHSRGRLSNQLKKK